MSVSILAYSRWQNNELVLPKRTAHWMDMGDMDVVEVEGGGLRIPFHFFWLLPLQEGNLEVQIEEKSRPQAEPKKES